MLLALLLTLSAHAYDGSPECKAVLKSVAPDRDLPSKEEIASLTKCDSSHAYYGIGEKVDYVRARKCAFAQREHGEDIYWGGSTILYMIYANGQGVTKDRKIALHFACDAEGAPAEISARIEHLKRDEPIKHDEPIDWCDDITSGYAQGFCQGLANDKASALRAAEFAKLPFKGEAFEKLKKASEVFTKARSDLEVDQSGTGRAAFMLAEEDIQQRDFLESLQTFAAGKAPKFNRKKEDDHLNDVFKKVLAVKNPADVWGTVTKNGILKTEKAWVAYRNAWKEFAGSDKADMVDAWFTKKRAHMLEGFLKH